MSLLDHPLWMTILPYFVIETYDRDGSARDPRVRLELDRMPLGLTADALKIMIPCCACARPMHPIRQRKPPGAKKRTEARGQCLYVAVACELAAGYGCSRGGKARDEYVRIKLAVRRAHELGLIPQMDLPGTAPELDDAEGARRAIERRQGLE